LTANKFICDLFCGFLSPIRGFMVFFHLSADLKGLKLNPSSSLIAVRADLNFVGIKYFGQSRE